jgi:dyslexia susceptibility 1 candidate gene 1 protein
MPILIKDFTWHQTQNKISINLPLRGVKRSPNIDTFITEEYLKVSYPPYLFEAILPHKIEVDSSHGVFSGNLLKVTSAKSHIC